MRVLRTHKTLEILEGFDCFMWPSHTSCLHSSGELCKKDLGELRGLRELQLDVESPSQPLGHRNVNFKFLVERADCWHLLADCIDSLGLWPSACMLHLYAVAKQASAMVFFGRWTCF